jgi:HEPN domain-containing protein
MQDDNNFGKYADQSCRYMEDARKHLETGDYDKASEFLWGSVAEAIKALAAKRGQMLKTHGELWKLLRVLAIELDEPQLIEDFRTANFLHMNFYENELQPDQVISAIEPIQRLQSGLLELAETVDETRKVEE